MRKLSIKARHQSDTIEVYLDFKPNSKDNMDQPLLKLSTKRKTSIRQHLKTSFNEYFHKKYGKCNNSHAFIPNLDAVNI